MASRAEEPVRAENPAPAGRRRRKLALPDALPPLRGRYLAVFRIIWFAMFAAALLATVAGLHYHNRIHEWGEPYNELGLRAATLTGTDLGLPMGEETRRAGVAPRSKLIAIEGVKLPAVTTQAQVADQLRAVPGTHVRIRTRLPDGTERDHRLRRSPDHLKNAYAGNRFSAGARHQTEMVLSMIVVAMSLGAAFLLYRKAAGDPIASLLSLTLLLGIVVGEPGASTFTFFALKALWGKLAVLVGIGFVIVMFTFPTGRLRPRWPLLAILLYALLTLFPSSNMDVAMLRSFAAVAIVIVALAHLGLRYRRLQPSVERQQLRWAFFGFAASIAAGAVWLALLVGTNLATSEGWRIWGTIAAEIFQHLSTILLITGILVALLRYRLYDAETVISRSTGYAVLTLLLGGTFAAGSKGLEWAFETGFGRDAGALPGATAAGLAVVLISPLHNRVHRWAERRFQKALIRLKRDLPECVDDLRETATLAELTGEVLSRVATGVRTSRAAVLVGDQVAATLEVAAQEAAAWRDRNLLDSAGERLACNYSDPVFPARVPLRVRHGAHLVGWLLLGPRPDGSFYGKDEQEALAEIADPVARAVQIVLLREARDAAARRRGEEQERRLTALERQLAAALRALSDGRKPLASGAGG